MTRFPESIRPDALRQTIVELRRQVAAAAEVAAATSTTTVTGWTDAQPRWVAYPVAFGDFAVAASSVTITIATLPAGVSWTAVWVKPGTLFASLPAASLWRLGVDVPATGATAGGAPKTVDVTTPDALAQQAAQWYVQCDTSGTATVTATLDSGGGDNANAITAGDATIYLLLSVPGSTTDDLPHA